MRAILVELFLGPVGVDRGDEIFGTSRGGCRERQTIKQGLGRQRRVCQNQRPKRSDDDDIEPSNLCSPSGALLKFPQAARGSGNIHAGISLGFSFFFE